MGWFDEQIRARIEFDEDSFSKAFSDISEVISGERIYDSSANSTAYFHLTKGENSGTCEILSKGQMTGILKLFLLLGGYYVRT